MKNSETSEPLDCASSVRNLFAQYGIHPVLVEVGAAGPAHQTWDLIAPHSTYVGFDPDLREMREVEGTRFQRAAIMNAAVVPDTRNETVQFNLTRNPFCSSTLEPDLDPLSNYSFGDFFQIEQRQQVRAMTVAAALERLGLKRIDWCKIAANGIDLRIFNSIPEPLRAGVMCLEMVPGLMKGYHGEDPFIEVHRDLLRQGFWLSDAKVCGTARISQSSIQWLKKLRPELCAEWMETRCPKAPGWLEATYLRTLGYLDKHSAGASDFVLLWAMALANRQWGFALDVALAYANKFDSDGMAKVMADKLVEWFIGK